MNDLKIMARRIPYGVCPNCGHKQFMVIHSESHVFLTNRDGEIIDGSELLNTAVGKCLKCNKEVEMYPTSYGFIPLTPLRKFLYGIPKQEDSRDISQMHNPMLSKEDKK